MAKPLISFTSKGLFCEQGDFFIDPWKPVDKALVTHAHADHSYAGMKQYLAHKLSAPIMKHRLGKNISVQEVEYSEKLSINGVKVSFHPAGHIPGSAQIRVENKGEIWVISGDYKTYDDGISTAYEAVKCHHFITESTFGLPVFNWPEPETVHADMNQWWQRCNELGQTPFIFAYSLGKAQRVLANLNPENGTILTHAAVDNTNQLLAKHGIQLPPTSVVTPEMEVKKIKNPIVVAPPGALNSSWQKRFNKPVTSVASGWAQLRGMRRRRNTDKSFVLSDHADWNGLNQAVKASESKNIYVTHGYTQIFTKYLNEQGYNAQIVKTEFTGESLESEV